MKKIVYLTLLLILLAVFCTLQLSYAFGPSSHIYISTEHGNNKYPAGYPDSRWFAYFFNVISPDYLVIKNLRYRKFKERIFPADWGHSPDPFHDPELDPEFYFFDSHNMGYVMWVIAQQRNDTIENNEWNKAMALGWGSHIAEDWIAHHPKFNPIHHYALWLPGTWSDKAGFTRHKDIEKLMDFYVHAKTYQSKSL